MHRSLESTAIHTTQTKSKESQRPFSHSQNSYLCLCFLAFGLTTTLTIQIPNTMLHIPMVDKNSLRTINISLHYNFFNHKIEPKLSKCKKMCRIAIVPGMLLHQTPLVGKCEHLAHRIVDKSTIIECLHLFFLFFFHLFNTLNHSSFFSPFNILLLPLCNMHLFHFSIVGKSYPYSTLPSSLMVFLHHNYHHLFYHLLQLIHPLAIVANLIQWGSFP
jgi:hypothetical protein